MSTCQAVTVVSGQQGGINTNARMCVCMCEYVYAAVGVQNRQCCVIRTDTVTQKVMSPSTHKRMVARTRHMHANIARIHCAQVVPVVCKPQTSHTLLFFFL